MVNLPRVRVEVGLAAATALLLVCGCACKRPKGGDARSSDERPALGTVSVKPIPAVEAQGHALRLDEARLAAKVKSVLDEASVFAEPKPSRANVVVAVEAQPFVEGFAEALEIGVRLRLRMTVRPEGGAPARFGEDALAIGQAPLGVSEQREVKAAFDRLAERTAADLVLSYVGRQKLWSGESKEIENVLRSSDNDLRVEALRVVGARKLVALSPAVLHLLADEDENVRDAALGAAVALQDRAAVRTLAQSREMRDAREMRKILDAIAALGGPEARDYLGFVAETHDDEEIRAMAKASLERLSRRIAPSEPTR